MPPPYNYVLARWAWDTSEFPQWRAPAGTVGLVDLRPLPAQALESVAEGFGFFALDPAAGVPVGALNLGTDLNAAISDAVKRDAEERLELSVGDFSLATLLDNGWLTITDLADPTGQNRAKPLMPTVAGNLELHLGGHSIVKAERFDKVRHPWVRTMVQRDFGDRAAVNPRTLAALMRKYGFTAQEIIGIRGGATFTESFNTADSDTLGPDLTWTEVTGDADIVSNEYAQITAGVSRAEHDLDTDDHSCEITFTAIGTNNSHTLGVCTRFATAATTYYTGLTQARATGFHRIYKRVTGSYTQLATVANATGPALILKLEVDGSSLDYLVGGSSVTTATDTAITANTRFGVEGQAFGASGQTGDGLTAADLVAAATGPTPRQKLHRLFGW